MVKAKYQAKWRDRRDKGLIRYVDCPMCGKPCRASSNHAPLHMACWRKTDEGRAYLRQKKKESRERIERMLTKK